MAIRKRTTITFNQGLRGRKGKLNIITSMFANKYAVESFGSQKNLVLLQKLWVSFWVGFFQFRNQSTKEEISVNKPEESSNILYAGGCDNYNISCSKKSAKIL